MNWSSWAEFWDMGGYALYVWGSYGVVALGVALELWLAAGRRAEVLLSLRRSRDEVLAGEAA